MYRAYTRERTLLSAVGIADVTSVSVATATSDGTRGTIIISSQ